MSVFYVLISKWRMRAAALRVVDLCSTEKLVNLK